jgi:hypothetical protein
VGTLTDVTAQQIESASPEAGTHDPKTNIGPYQVIHLGDEAAAIVPLHDLRCLRALVRHASPEALDAAEAEAAAAELDEWEAAGCPGAMSHEEFMAELLGGPR